MRVTCPSCQTNYSIDDSRVPSAGAKLKCAKCQTIFPIKAQPASAPTSGAVPLPGIGGAHESASPTAGPSVPLPGAASGTVTASPGGTSVPLPGAASGPVAASSEGTSVPLPGSQGGDWVADLAQRLESVALPGASDAPPASQPESIQLPGADPLGAELGFTSADLLGPPSTSPLLSVPLPGGESSTTQATGSDPLHQTDPLFSAPESPGSVDLGDLGSLGEKASAAAADQIDFSDFGPAPEEASAPSAAAEAPAEVKPELELGAVEDHNFDIADPAPPSGSEDSSIELESDRSAQSAEIGFDVADAPFEKPSGQKLEELSFVDEGESAAESKGAGPRHYVRRKTGKVFGPFDESVIAKMLEAGQLSGTEEISGDKEAWTPLGAVPRFQELIEKLMQSPPEPAVDKLARPPQTAEQSATMDRLKRLYDGRMAAVSVVRSQSWHDGLGKRVPMLIGAGGLVLLIIAGAALGLTRFGVFGIKMLFPAQIARGSPQFKMLEDAHQALLTDTFKSYKDAVELSSNVLKVREYPEARAIWCQSIYYLQRRYAAASPADIVKANAALEGIRALGARNAEMVKTVAGAALAASRPAEVLGLLQDATARKENDADIELSFLLAEAYAIHGQRKLALEILNRILTVQKRSAKALHALGNLYQSGNEADKAAKAYADALEADPKHAASAVELAAVELLLRKNVQNASEAIDRALAPAAQALLGPAELARARSLKGVKLATEFKTQEAIAEFEDSLKLDPKSSLSRVRLAGLLLAQREYVRAAGFYKEVLANELQNLEATDGYLSALIGAGKMEDALTAVAQANVRFPGNVRIAYLYGRINDALDKPNEAEKHYKRAINAVPDFLEPTLYLAQLYLRFRRVDQAKAQLEAAAAQAPDDPRVHIGLGELALGERDLARSRAEFERAKALNPNAAEAHLGLSRLALENGSLEEAQKSIQKALQLDPNVKGGMLQHGLVLWKSKKIPEAVAELKKAKAQEPRSTVVAVTIGAVMQDQGDLVGSETHLLGALSLDPANADAHFYLAKLKSRRGEYHQAIDTMKTALERAPNRASFHYELGLIYRDAKKLTEAIPEWKRAVELDPAHADSLEALGQAYLDGGEFAKAVDSFEAALRIDATRTKVLGLIGDAHFQAAKWDQAIAKYHQALKRDPSLIGLYYRLGRAYTEKGQHSQAIACYLKATQADRRNPLPYYYLGFAYKERNRRNEAIEAFKRYLALKDKPDDQKEIEDEIYDLQH
jgi:predicted Zn finger-like uncharacterized protein